MPRDSLPFCLLIATFFFPLVAHAEVNGGERLDWIVADSSVIIRGTISDVTVTEQ